MLNELKSVLESKFGLTVNSLEGELKSHKVIAERKGFLGLSSNKLEYSNKVKVDESKKEVTFSEMLKETSSGLQMGAGVETTSYSTGLNGNSGTIEEQNTQFGKKYNYNFNYSEIREEIKKFVEERGYSFKYVVI